MRAQGISINVIVITAIALIVLVLLVVVLTGRVQLFSKGLGTCKGFCTDSSAKCGTTHSALPTPNCNDGQTPVIESNNVCCIPTS